MNKGKEKNINARTAAYLVLRQIEEEQAYANIAFNKLINYYSLQENETRLAAQIVYGTTRMRLALDYILNQFLTKSTEELMPELRTILRLSLYQLHYLHTQNYAVVNEGVNLSKRYTSQKLAGLTNGVLRNYLRSNKCNLLPSKESNFIDYLNITLSMPRWIVDYLVNHFTLDEAEAFCNHANTYQGMAIRTNTLKITREKLKLLLAQAKVDSEPVGYAPETLRLSADIGNLTQQPLFSQGYFSVQGLSSQLAAHVLNPRPGSTVLDLCAGPGGKTTHLAELMHNQGIIHAFDLFPHKVKLIQDYTKRLDVDIVKAMVADSRKLPDFYRNWADYILLDVPCSGLGILNMRADSRFHKNPNKIRELAQLAYELIEVSSFYLKVGGKLCYTTCTITEEENSANIYRFLSEHPEFSRCPFEKVSNLIPELSQEIQKGELQLLPFRGNKVMEGFYFALLEKKE